MSVPATRQEFKEYCLRRLGKPVIKINVDDDQVEDRIDEALLYYADYHFDGTEKIYYKHQVTETDIQNKYITIPENIIGVINVFDLGSAINSTNFFDIRYQIALNDLWTFTAVSMIPYYMTFQHIQVLEELLTGKQPIRYNRHMNRLYIDMDWNKVDGGKWLIAESYQVLDPNVYTNVWGDRWLLRYVTQLIKKQWGGNLKKFTNMQLPGNVSFDGQKIYDEAEAELEKLEAEMINSYSIPIAYLIG